MTSAPQQEMLKLLAQLLELSPDVRLGQLLAHLSFLSEDRFDRSLWDIEDQQLLELLAHHRSELIKRQEHVA